MSRQLQLNSNDVLAHGAECVVYVMSRDQRVADNFALAEAQKVALDRELPLVVLFNLLEKTGHRSQQQYEFMLTGLREVAKKLKLLNIGFGMTFGQPTGQLLGQLEHLKPAEVIFDFSPLRGPRSVQKKIASQLSCSVKVVDTHNIIPLWVLSDKEEYAAHTIRTKVHKNMQQWLVEPHVAVKHPHSPDSLGLSADWVRSDSIAQKQPSTQVRYSFKSGEAAAHVMLSDFIATRMNDYAKQRNIPVVDGQSNLSPYLHFGQLSALRIALDVIAIAPSDPLLFEKGKLASYEGEPTQMDSINAFLEELIVRRELADNFCFYNQSYDRLDGAKDWAKKTLQEHRNDSRDYVYSQQQWEQAKTHDEPWNAAQQELLQTGKLHGYMRMYWAKKILEFSESPEAAIEIAIYLNDKYSIDGGDPNGYTGIMWSIAGVHDRPWFERAVFGKIRYMNRGGLERRFDVVAYMQRYGG